MNVSTVYHLINANGTLNPDGYEKEDDALRAASMHGAGVIPVKYPEMRTEENYERHDTSPEKAAKKEKKDKEDS